jgi:tetratricopeptide (TPR) repeat protein
MDPNMLRAAIHHFEQAVALDPKYALAWSGMGTAHALLFISTSDPQDIARASICLERATELDPELAEPYPWLCNIRFRRDDVPGALEAGQKGVDLQPDLPEAHYFHGTWLCYLLPEYDTHSAPVGLRHIAQSVVIEPRFHPGWVVLGAAAAFAGRHPEAIRILNEAVLLEAEPDLLYRFAGARTLLAFAYARMGDLDAAQAFHRESLEALRDTPHIYTSCFRTLSACGLGEIELARRDGNSALTHFRRARTIILESRRVIGSPRLMLRANSGLAAAHALTNDRERALEIKLAVVSELRDSPPSASTATFESSMAQLWMCLAVAQVYTGDLNEAAASVVRACDFGWHDCQWLETSCFFEQIRAVESFSAALARLRSASQFELPLLPFGRGSVRRETSSP